MDRGLGDKIDIWRDNWGFEGLSGASIRLDRQAVQVNKVSDLLNNEKVSWNKSRIFEIYGDFLGDQICKIPLFHNSPDDYYIWYHNPFGYYSTKSAYSWLTLKHVGYGPHRNFWRLAWKIQTLPKIKIFCWHLGHDIFPSYEKISSIRKEVNSNCPRCESDKETLIHAMRDCPRARAVLVYGGLNNKVLEGTYSRCVDWLEDVARMLDKKALSDLITVLWNIWNSRNNKVFHDKEDDAMVTWDSTATLSRDFRIFNFLECLMILKLEREQSWRKPD